MSDKISTIRRKFRRIEKQIAKLGSLKIAEDIAVMRRIAPDLYIDMSPCVLRDMASEARYVARGVDVFGYWDKPKNKSERRLWVQVGRARDRAADALQDLLQALTGRQCADNCARCGKQSL